MRRDDLLRLRADKPIDQAAVLKDQQGRNAFDLELSLRIGFSAILCLARSCGRQSHDCVDNISARLVCDGSGDRPIRGPARAAPRVWQTSREFEHGCGDTAAGCGGCRATGGSR